MIAAPDSENPNLAMLEIAAHALGDLCDSLVFIGGCATGLLVTTVRAQIIRATEDVDVVVKVATIAGYHHVEAQLAARGFKHDTSPEALDRAYLTQTLHGLTTSPEFLDALPGHLPGDAASQTRVPEILRRLRELARDDT